MLDTLNKMKQAQRGPLRGKDRYHVDQKGSFDYETQKYTPFSGEAGGMTGSPGMTGDDPGVVRLKNGTTRKSSELEEAYYANFTVGDMLGAKTLRPNAPSFVDWYNSIVSPEYAINDSMTQRPEQVDPEEERRLAEKDVRGDMGWRDYIPFNEPSSQDIDARQQQRQAMRGGMTQDVGRPPELIARPEYQKAQEQVPEDFLSQMKPVYIDSNGNRITQARIIETARKRNMPVTEVIRKLGLR